MSSILCCCSWLSASVALTFSSKAAFSASSAAHRSFAATSFSSYSRVVSCSCSTSAPRSPASVAAARASVNSLDAFSNASRASPSCICRLSASALYPSAADCNSCIARAPLDADSICSCMPWILASYCVTVDCSSSRIFSKRSVDCSRLPLSSSSVLCRAASSFFLAASRSLSSRLISASLPLNLS